MIYDLWRKYDEAAFTELKEQNANIPPSCNSFFYLYTLNVKTLNTTTNIAIASFGEREKPDTTL